MLPKQPFKVAHQKVSMDVDLAGNSVQGYTEIIVIPLDSQLKQIQLDCGLGINIDAVTVNNRKCYFQAVGEPEFGQSLHNYHHYRGKLGTFSTTGTTPHLLVNIPNSLKLTLQESKSTPHSVKTPTTVAEYTPLSIKIDYNFKNPKSGLHFVGGAHTKLPKESWHCYSVNSTFGSTASNWVPCIDAVGVKSTWELEFAVPQFMDGDEDLPLTVVSSDTPRETPHPKDKSKKLVLFTIFNPVSAHHFGFVIGCFKMTTLPTLADLLDDFENEDEAEVDKDTMVPVNVYTPLDSNDDDILNTCVVVQKIIDFYSKEFGSFPFASHSIIMVSGLASHADFAAMTVLPIEMLYSADLIDPVFSVTSLLSRCLATQWSGVNITPQDYNDFWCCIGIAGFMSLQFTRKLIGVNEFKYRLKKLNDVICERDIAQRPIGDMFPVQGNITPLPLNTRDLEFLWLKAPMVLFILDRRMTKTDRSFGMSRIIPKIFLQAMSGDLKNNNLTSQHFQHVCERVNRNRLDDFFKQWVYRSGVPILRVTQRFNKKRMVVEMGIRQTQAQEVTQVRPSEPFFIQDAKKYLESTEYVEDLDSDDENKNAYGLSSSNVFTGPLTIRIHEADGTPYEHIVELKDTFTKLDIQYNTKYKRLKRRRKAAQAAAAAQAQAQAGGTGIPDDEMDDDEEGPAVLIHCLGDVLLTPEEQQRWSLTDSQALQPDYETVDSAFEWIRVDADFEWLGRIYINQPDYMFVSQLQQDRDVEAQIGAIRFFEEAMTINNQHAYSSVLCRTLFDERYFYGVRLEAARVLSTCVISTTKPVKSGAYHLMEIFKEFFCFDDSTVPRSNDFRDFQKYFIQSTIPLYLANVKDDSGSTPKIVRMFLLNLLKFNDNSNNAYQDCFYVEKLIESLINTVCDISPKSDLLKQVVEELHRYGNLDLWIPSYHKIITKAVLSAQLKLALHGLYTVENWETIFKYVLEDDVVLAPTAFKVALLSGGMKNKDILDLFFYQMQHNVDPLLRQSLCDVLTEVVNKAAFSGMLGDLDEDPTIIIDDMNDRREIMLRGTFNGTIDLLRSKFKEYTPLKIHLWDALRSDLLNAYQRRQLFDIVSVMYEPLNEWIVRLPTPRDKKLVAKTDGFVVTIKREGLLKVQLPKKETKLKLSIKSSAAAAAPHSVESEANSRKSQISSAQQTPAPKITLKTTSKSTSAAPVSLATPAAANVKAASASKSSTLDKTALPKSNPTQVSSTTIPSADSKSEVRKSRPTKVTIDPFGTLPMRFVKIRRNNVTLSSLYPNKRVKVDPSMKVKIKYAKLKTKAPKLKLKLSMPPPQ